MTHQIDIVIIRWIATSRWGQLMSWNQDCRISRERNVTNTAPKTVTRRLSVSTVYPSSPDVKQARLISCDQSVGAARDSRLQSTEYNAASNFKQLAFLIQWHHRNYNGNEKSQQYGYAVTEQLARYGKRAYKYRVQCNNNSPAFANPISATAKQRWTARNNEWTITCTEKKERKKERNTREKEQGALGWTHNVVKCWRKGSR